MSHLDTKHMEHETAELEAKGHMGSQSHHPDSPSDDRIIDEKRRPLDEEADELHGDNKEDGYDLNV